MGDTLGAVRFSGVLGSSPAPHSSGTQDGQDNLLTMALGTGGHLNVSGIDFGATSVMRVDAAPGPAAGPTLQQDRSGLICVFTEGGDAGLREGSKSFVTAGAGSCWTYGGSAKLTIDWSWDSSAVIAIVPHQVVRDFGLVPSTGLILMPVVSTLIEPTRNFLRSMVADRGHISSVAAYFMEKLVHEMVGGLFLEASATEAGGTRRPTLYHQAMALITASAGDHALTPESLARDLNVSLRHLQRDFQKRNESVADRIRQTRVDLAVRLLTDPAMAVLSLEEIATHSGFASLGQLRRTLHSVGAGTPRDIRAFGVGQPELAAAGTVSGLQENVQPPTP